MADPIPAANTIKRGPLCPHCHNPMMLNEANSTPYSEQYVCHCQGFLYHLNVHKGQRSR